MSLSLARYHHSQWLLSWDPPGWLGSRSHRQAVQQQQKFSNAFIKQENLHDSTLYTNTQTFLLIHTRHNIQSRINRDNKKDCLPPLFPKRPEDSSQRWAYRPLVCICTLLQLYHQAMGFVRSTLNQGFPLHRESSCEINLLQNKRIN